MEKQPTHNNHVVIIGEITQTFTYSYTICGEDFYMSTLSVERRSRIKDLIPLMVSADLINVNKNYRGQAVAVSGQYRSYNYYEQKKRKVALWVFAKTIEFADKAKESGQNSPCRHLSQSRPNSHNNHIYLHGHLCKPPIFRQTPLGREITELLLAVNRPYGKSDYIPCICWYVNAVSANEYTVGDQCEVWGRIQSREYQKQLADGHISTKTAYEVSVSKLELTCSSCNSSFCSDNCELNPHSRSLLMF